MLLELKVSHFAVIDSLQVSFLRPGLNVLTGETGAGKSVLLKSLSLLLGGKASSDLIRAEHENAIIEGAFDLKSRSDIRKELDELALGSGDDTLVVRRIVSHGGKNRIYINGNLSTLNILESLLSRLVEITGQHEHHSLLKPQVQLGLLDEYAQLGVLRAKLGAQYEHLKSITCEIEQMSLSTRERDQRLDFLRFQIQEIESFNPAAGEDEKLPLDYQRARFASKLHSFAERGEEILYTQDASAHAVVSDLLREGEALVDLDPRLKPALQNLREAAILLEDAAFNFRDYAKGDAIDREQLEKLEERLSSLKKLQKKYGTSADEIVGFLNKAKAECSTLEKAEGSLKELNEKLKLAEAGLGASADDLHKKRFSAARALSEKINAEIRFLNMKGVELLINVERTESIGPTGADSVQFMIRSSPKDEPKPINRIASGGELSRLMLAIKQVVSASEMPMTYLFDEVDTGVSGSTAEKVGKKLKAIGRHHQVICITHLPQVAAFADAHFKITKNLLKGQMVSQVCELNRKDRVQELSRMLSGEKITAASLAHARELLGGIESNSKQSLNI